MIELNRKQRKFVFNFILSVLFLSIIFLIFWKLRPLIFPTILGALLAYIFKPFLSSFKSFGMPEYLRVTLLTTIFTTFVLCTTWLIRENIPSEKDKLVIMTRFNYHLNQKSDEFFEKNINEEERSFLVKLVAPEVLPILEDLRKVIKLSDTQKQKFINYYDDGQIEEKYFKYFNTNNSHLELEVQRDISQVSENSNTHFSISRLINVFSIWIVMPLVFLFLLFDNGQIMKYFMSFIPNKYLELSHTVFEEVDLAIGKYLRGTLLESFLVGFTMLFGFTLIGMPFQAALLISVFAGLTNAIPYLGPLVGLVVAGSYALIAENINPLIPFIAPEHFFLGILVTIIITQILDNVIFQPIVLAQAVNLHALVVVFALVGGSLLFGFAGLLLAIPCVVIFKVILETLVKGLKDYKII